MNLPEIQKIMREFEKQNEVMEMTSETMGDAIDDAIEVIKHSYSPLPWCTCDGFEPLSCSVPSV